MSNLFGSSESRHPLDTSEDPTEFHIPKPKKKGQKYKTELCTNYHKYGYCVFGSNCNFVHEMDFFLPSTSSNGKINRLQVFQNLE